MGAEVSGPFEYRKAIGLLPRPVEHHEERDVSSATIHVWEDLVWKDDGLSTFDDEPCVGVEEQVALRAAQHSSGDYLAIHESHVSSRSSGGEKFLVHGPAATAGASELSVERLLRLLGRSELVFVPLDGLQEELRVHLFEHRHK